MLTCRRLLGLFLGVFLAVSQVPGTARASLLTDEIFAAGQDLAPASAFPTLAPADDEDTRLHRWLQFLLRLCERHTVQVARLWRVLQPTPATK